jgi:two-component system chemotaxis response regulator CheY
MVDPKLRILVVDDMSSMRKIIIKVLKEMGFTEFSEANDGQPAWELLNGGQTKIDLVISDWNMPGVTGLELLRNVRGHATLKTTPFIMVTAETEAHQIAEAIKLQVDNYVTNPVAPVVLREKIEATLKRKGLWKAAA